MDAHIFRLVGMGITLLLMLVVGFFLFKNAGEKMGFFLPKKTKIAVTLVGFVIAIAINADVFLDRDMVRQLQMFDFAFFTGFSAFCFGMFEKKKNG
jgi:hypothetical protein